MKKWKEENGAISVVVLATILFFVTVLTGTYVISAATRKAQLQSQIELKDEYAKSLDYRYMDDITRNMKHEKTLLQALKDGDVRIGDYVNYQAPEINDTVLAEQSGARTEKEDELEPGKKTYTELEQSFHITQQDSEEMGWQILGYGDANGNLLANTEEGRSLAEKVLLIAANPTQQPLALGQYHAYLNGPDILNNLCANFATGDNSARSINIDDIRTALGYTVNYPVYNQEGKIETAGLVTIEETSCFSQFSSKASYTYQEGDYAIAENSFQGKLNTGNENIGTQVEGNGYLWLEPNNIVYTDNTLSDMLRKEYWLASNYIDTEETYVEYAIGTTSVFQDQYALAMLTTGIFNSDGKWKSMCNCVRPVIALSSDVLYGTDTENGEIATTVAPTGWSITEGYSLGETASGNYNNE